MGLLPEIIAALLFVGSTGILFNDKFRKNRLLVLCAAAIALASTYLLTEQVVRAVVRQTLDQQSVARQNAPPIASGTSDPFSGTWVLVAGDCTDFPWRFERISGGYRRHFSGGVDDFDIVGTEPPAIRRRGDPRVAGGPTVASHGELLVEDNSDRVHCRLRRE